MTLIRYKSCNSHDPNNRSGHSIHLAHGVFKHGSHCYPDGATNTSLTLDLDGGIVFCYS